MTIRLFINELSFPTMACALDEAANRLDSLVAAFRAAKAIDRGMRIDSHIPLSQLALATNWPLAALRNQPRSKETGLYVQLLQDRAPFNAAFAEAPDDGAGGPEYRVPNDATICAGEVSLGLGLAHRLDGVSISLITHADWQSNSVDLDRHALDAEGEISIERVAARNAVDAEGIGSHSPFLSAFVRAVEVNDGAEIWARRGELFPHLRFLPRVEKQLSDLLHGDPLVDVVFDRLRRLEAAIGSWRETGVELPPYTTFIRRQASGDEKYSRFRDEEGNVRLFTLHGDYGPGENRYHFLTEEEPTRTALVGHVGRKLGI